MTTTETASRVVYCECGIGLHGDSDEALLKAAERHIALDHDRLLHGAGPDTGRRASRRMYQTARSSLCWT
jgi:hypothetical protein